MKHRTRTWLLLGLLPLLANAQPPTEAKVSQDEYSKTGIMEDQKTETHSFNEYQAVVEAIRPYIESAKSGDGKLSRSAFYDHAHILGSIGGELYNMTADQFGDAVQAGGPAENIQHHIAWIDISGPAAAAKVEFLDWNGMRYTDFFVLYKEEGRWSISGKVFDSHSKN